MRFFHQNMRTFGGAAGQRNVAYNAAFTAIAAGFAANPITVAGFTEVVNNGAAAAAFGVGGLCAALGVNHFANIACGTTALANGPEYVAIGVLPGTQIVGYGRVFLDTAKQRVDLIDDFVAAAGPPAAAWQNAVHPRATADFRGPVYVVVDPGGGAPHVGVAFLHNLFTLEANRQLVAQQVPNVLALILKHCGGGGVAVIGGDLNVDVITKRGTDRTACAYASAIGLVAMPAAPPPRPPAAKFVAGGTTWAGSLYDYWYSTLNPAAPALPAGVAAPVATVCDSTLDSGAGVGNQMSDHCASVLAM